MILDDFGWSKNGHFCRPELMRNRVGWAKAYREISTTDSATFFTSFFIQIGSGASQMSKIIKGSKNLGLDPGGLPELDAKSRAGFESRRRRSAALPALPEVETQTAARTPQTVRTLFG